MISDVESCKNEIERMLRNAQTKVIFPVLTLALVKDYLEKGQTVFSDGEVKRAYEKTVKYLSKYLGHNLHIGGKYYDAYSSRNLPRYGVLRAIGKNRYELLPAYVSSAETLLGWIPETIKQYVIDRLGVIPLLEDYGFRGDAANDSERFLEIVRTHIDKNATNFEVFCFAVIKVHLEKFACRIYRDTRTSAHDRGIDMSTNYGVVYQIKKIKVHSKNAADDIYAELKANFDIERLHDGNVIVIIDDILKEFKDYLINMKVQSISKNDLLKLASQFEDVEDREKVLRIVYDEFRREYSSSIK